MQQVHVGDRVRVIDPATQEAIGGTDGVVVGDTGAAAGPTVIVALDHGGATNAVLDPADLCRVTDEQTEPSYNNEFR